jgi:hypothetical protein
MLGPLPTALLRSIAPVTIRLSRNDQRRLVLLIVLVNRAACITIKVRNFLRPPISFTLLLLLVIERGGMGSL